MLQLFQWLHIHAERMFNAALRSKRVRLRLDLFKLSARSPRLLALTFRTQDALRSVVLYSHPATLMSS
jgi:hypothetical protein